MNRLKSNLITAGIVLVVLVLLAIAFLFIPFRSGNALQVSFIGYTNDALAGKLAIFTVTNISNESISFLSCSPQTSNFGRRPQIQFDEDEDEKTVLAHAATNFTLIVITNSAVWRQPVFWGYDRRSELEDVRSKVKRNLYFNWRLISSRKTPHYFDVSPVPALR